jgi:phosphoglycolate phosphatase
MTMVNKALVFDFDGTLIDSAPGILRAFADALRESGTAPKVSLDSSLIGPPLKETLMRLSGSDDPALIRALSEHFKHHYDSIGVATTGAYLGIDEMLNEFSKAGVIMHLSTNKRLSVTQAILARLGWRNHFVSVYALDMVEPRLSGKTQLLSKQLSEQQLDPTATIYIGDKFEDGQAAKANGLEFHYASWGYGDLQREQLDGNWNWLSRPADLNKSLQS